MYMHKQRLIIILTLDKDTELLSSHPACCHLYFECHEDGEEEFVHLVQTPCSVLVDQESQVIDDVVDALAGDGRLLGARHGKVEELQELSEGGLVHHIHHAHLHNDEIQDAASQSH